MKAIVGIDPGGADKTTFMIVKQTVKGTTFTPAEIEPHPNPVIEAAIKAALARMQPELDAYVEAIMQHGAVRLDFRDGKLVAEPVRPGALFLP